MASTSENDLAFHAVCGLLSNHTKGADSPEQTLNRLFQKHLVRKPSLATNSPRLSRHNVSVTREERKKLSFVGLARYLESGQAHDSADPIVIVRYRGVDCLIDGSHRCRQWYKDEDLGDHTAYVLVVDEAKVN
jgi:hypothetical protein